MGFCYLLLTCALNKNVDVTETISKLPGVEEAIPVTGAYDCVVKTKLTSEEINNFVLSNIRPLDNVRSVLTLYDAPLLILS